MKSKILKPYRSIPLLAVLFLYASIIHAEELPPLPPHDPTPIQLVALGDIPAAIVIDPTKPTERKELKDGQIIEWKGGELVWHVERSLFIVEKTFSLIDPRWMIIEITSANEASVYPAGFYRVRRIKHPVPPPTHPPKQTPIVSDAPRVYTPAIYAGGFR